MSKFRLEAIKHGVAILSDKNDRKLAVCSGLRSRHRCKHNCSKCVWRVEK